MEPGLDLTVVFDGDLLIVALTNEDITNVLLRKGKLGAWSLPLSLKCKLESFVGA